MCDTFIDCESMSISGDARGIFSISFNVYSVSPTLSEISNELTLFINGQEYRGYVLNHTPTKIANTPLGVDCVYYEHSLQLATTSPV